MNLDSSNLLIKTISRGGWDHLVEMTHLPTGLTARMEGLQKEISLATLQSKARKALSRAVTQRLSELKEPTE